MKRTRFVDDLAESVQQMDEIYLGKRKPSRSFDIVPTPRAELAVEIGFDTSSTPPKARNEKAL